MTASPHHSGHAPSASTHSHPHSHGAVGVAAGSTAGPATTLSGRLREATGEQHTRAERHPVQQALVRGAATPRQYATWLRAMRALHDSFESHLARARRVEALAPAIEDHHFRIPHIDHDLDALAKLDPSTSTNGAGARGGTLGPATRAIWATVEAAIDVDPAVVIGPFYVLEGSTNGGRYIAMAIRKSMPFPEGTGTRYLDPHGELTRERWARTKMAYDALPLTAAQHAAIIVAAQQTFDAVTALMDELPPA